MDLATKESLQRILDDAVSESYLVTFCYDCNKGHTKFRERLMDNDWEIWNGDKRLPNTTVQKVFRAKTAPLAKRQATVSIQKIKGAFMRLNGFHDFEIECSYYSAEMI